MIGERTDGNRSDGDGGRPSVHHSPRCAFHTPDGGRGIDGAAGERGHGDAVIIGKSISGHVSPDHEAS